jgi:hypothetical protein
MLVFRALCVPNMRPCYFPKGVLEEGRGVIFTRHSCPPSNSIKTVAIFLGSAVGVVLELGLRAMRFANTFTSKKDGIRAG